jgi:aminopeptidase N
MRAVLLASTFLALALATPAVAEAPAVPAAVAALAPVPKGRLTDAVTPAAYRLDLTIDPAKERFSGHVEIDATLNAASRFVDLHGRDLAMKKAVAIVGGQRVAGIWTQMNDSGVARLSFPQELPAGAVTLVFDYDAPFTSGPAGMFRVKVGDDWYSWTQFESTDARAAFPGFDQPGYKAPFTVTLRTPPGLKTVSNSPETGTTLENGLEVHRFAPTLPLPTYLVAMMAGPFAVVAGTVPPTPQRDKPLPLRIVSTKENAGQLNFALEGSKGIITHLENYFGQSFPYPKLDQITAPIMPGAMENAGADLYQDGLLVMAEDAPVPQKRAFGMVVAHELAHQWFGDLVTPEWWDDIWLNESFANWMGYRIGNEWRPDLNIGAGATAEGFAAMSTDALVAGRPIHQKIDTTAQIDAAFDTITYGKGGHVVAMIAAYMGDTKFHDGVRRYMATHRYGNATSADFFGAMADVAGDPRILPAMQSFTDQQGVPLLTFTGGKGHYTVTQSRYARSGATPPETRWGIPMCVRRGETRDCTLLTEPSAAISVGGSGVFMPNAGGTGYYRFELPMKDWNALIVGADKLSGGEALALADSLRASYQAGRSNATMLVRLARSLARNPDSYASGAALDGLEMMKNVGLFDEAAIKNYRAFVDQLYRPLLAGYGFEPKAGAYASEDPERIQRRNQIVGALSGTAQDEAVRKQLGDAAAAYLGGNKAALDAMWFDDAFEAWLSREGVAGARKLFDLALKSEDPVFRPMALGAIASTGKADVATWLFNDAKDQRLRASERLNMVRLVVSTPGTRDQGYVWMKDHLDELMGGAGGIFFASRLPQMLTGFCSVERSDEFARDLRPRFVGKSGALELERTIERVKSCGVLKKARSAEASKEISALK